jgi:negative regulator of flagellin synthesis FlgM
MDMKIEQATKLNTAQLVKEARGPSVKKPENASDEVQLSSLASQLLASESAAPFDTGRVTEIKQAISEGKFSINAGAIADRLITSARELLDSRHQV